MSVCGMASMALFVSNSSRHTHAIHTQRFKCTVSLHTFKAEISFSRGKEQRMHKRLTHIDNMEISFDFINASHRWNSEPFPE